jgi:FKBP-type peptidyl-prolyl cis-trans isomerase FkpA
MTKFIALLILPIVLFSCGTYSEEQKKSFDQQIVSYLKKKDVKCTRTDSGLYYKIIEPGEGEYIQFTDIVSFSYRGYFMNGQTFDNHKYPVEFAVKDLIGAWKEIMLELKPGAKAFLVAPPTLGYGDRVLEDIPANSILVFEMEIKSVK